MDWLGLKGKTAIVTGGASGIGRAVAGGLAAVGVRVVVADVDASAARSTCASLPCVAGGCHAFVGASVATRDGADAMVAAALALSPSGVLDILVNNAGISVPRLLVDPAGVEELSEELWDRTMAINQKGVFLCAQAAARAMLRNPAGGVIVNVSSESGLEGSEGQSAYAATKAALYSLTRSWAKELGRHGIRVVGVAPGVLEATALRNDEYERALAYARGVTVAALREAYTRQSIPLGREGRLAEVADVVVYLASARASYVHGTVINISGGKSRA